MAVGARHLADAQGSAGTLYVAMGGDDAWSGTKAGPNRGRTDGPFATLDRARDAIRQAKRTGKIPRGGITVEVAAGTYRRTRPFALAAEDSGTAESPIVYRARSEGEVRITGGRVITGWKLVKDAAVLAHLNPTARGHVYVADLRAMGFTDPAPIRPLSGPGQSEPGMELFFADSPMRLARWPNRGFVKIADVINNRPVDVRGTKGDQVGKIVYEGDRPLRWTAEKDGWLHGYWFWDWSDQRQRIESIDTERRVITLAKPYHVYGYRTGQWYYAFNLFSELDEPQEWYLDRGMGLLYFWPPTPLEVGRAAVSELETLVTLDHVSNVTFRGFTLEATRGTAVSGTAVDHVRIAACTIRNVGGWAVSIAGSRDSGVYGCDITQTGAGGISLQGGDSKSLTPANLVADNNHIHHYSRWNPMYNPAVQIAGVGNRATHNLIHDAPHMAIGFGGQDNRIEYNEIHDVCTESNDAGAMYAGRNWTMRGTQIRFNYLHDIQGFEGKGCVGVYLDDQFSGTLVYGNLFHKVTRAAMIGGGRDCTIENNVFVDCVPATHVDARGLGWAADGFGGLKASLESLPYKQAPWSTRFPQLVNILNDDPMAPKGNLIARNICVGGRWGDFEANAKPMVRFVDNLLDGDLRFVDRARGNFQLRPDSPALRLGFKQIPFEKIGLYRSHDRPKVEPRPNPGTIR